MPLPRLREAARDWCRHAQLWQQRAQHGKSRPQSKHANASAGRSHATTVRLHARRLDVSDRIGAIGAVDLSAEMAIGTGIFEAPTARRAFEKPKGIGGADPVFVFFN